MPVCFSWKRESLCMPSDHCAEGHNMHLCMREQVHTQWSVEFALAVIALSFREYLWRRMESCSAARTYHHHYHHRCKNRTHHRREPYHRSSWGCKSSTCCSGARNDREPSERKSFEPRSRFTSWLHLVTSHTNLPLIRKIWDEMLLKLVKQLQCATYEQLWLFFLPIFQSNL